MYRICKSFKFDAGHHLVGLHEGHKCMRPHGHTYTVRVTFRAQDLDRNGMVYDLSELSKLKAHIDRQYDHRNLNDFMAQPTVENIARDMFEWCRDEWPNVEKVRVFESDSAWGEYGR